MDVEILRDYGCKDEELIFCCRFAASSLNRDLPDFTKYSSKFDRGYLTEFEGDIAVAMEVIMPRTLMLERKMTTTRLHATMDGVLEPLGQLNGYVSLAKNGVTISVADFGFKALRATINSRDAEGAFKNLQLVNANVVKFKTVLTEQGLSQELIDALVAAAASIAADKQSQYEIEIKRRTIQQSNIGLFNKLNSK